MAEFCSICKRNQAYVSKVVFIKKVNCYNSGKLISKAVSFGRGTIEPKTFGRKEKLEEPNYLWELSD